MDTSTSKPVSDSPGALALLYRVNRNDHKVVSQVLAEDASGVSGLVFDARYLKEQESLRQEAHQMGIWTLLDPKTIELAFPQGHQHMNNKLTWMTDRPHTVADFRGASHASILDNIAIEVFTNQLSGIYAPCHYLEDGAHDPWLDIDRQSVFGMRVKLDEMGIEHATIYYTLCLPKKLLLDPRQRRIIKDKLKGLPIDALSIRIPNMGHLAGAPTILNLVAACRDFHELDVPILIERCEENAVAIASFGAVSGIVSGISRFEDFNAKELQLIDSASVPYGNKNQIFIDSLGIYLNSDDAKLLLSSKGMKKLACNDSHCCKRYKTDMIQGHREHFMRSRRKEMTILNQKAPTLRVHAYFDEILTPRTNLLEGVVKKNALPEKLQSKIDKQATRLENQRKALRKPRYQMAHVSFPPPLEPLAQHMKTSA